MEWNGFKGKAKRIEDIDIPRIGFTIGVGEDELHAFMDVEAAGSGFDRLGRPKMLFEPHVFYRNLSGEKRTRAVREGLAYPNWRRNYPKDSYPRLVSATAIDETAALKSASWGLGQILGENYRNAGYKTPQAMVQAFMDDEEDHLEAIVHFLKASGIDDDLRAHRWDTVARVYNGPAYKIHNYDGRMASAFARWKRIRDTSWTPGVDIDPPIEDVIHADGPEGYPALRPGDGYLRNLELKPYVIRAQEALAARGLYKGSIDGKYGPTTKSAVEAFQRTSGLTVDGVVGGKETWPALMTPVVPVMTITEVTVVEEDEAEETVEPRKGVGGTSSLYGA